MRITLGQLGAIFALAFALRLAFVLWAPGQPSGDGLFYHAHAVDLLAGHGYVNLDRSPANTWMPGWPVLLAVVYLVFGEHPTAAMVVNALLSAATAVMVALLGERLFCARTGLIAGLLYAAWPGLVYYSATLFNESAFAFALAAMLLLFLRACRFGPGFERAFAWAGLGLGVCGWIKAEPLMLVPALLAVMAVSASDRAQLARAAALFVGITVLCILPWTIRNAFVFDRFIPTAAGGGMVIAVANHPGASGGNDLAFLMRYVDELGVADRSQAEQNIAMNDDAWRRALRFFVDEPREALGLFGRKLALTYGDDSDAADAVRGFFGEARWHLERKAWERLVAIANVWWFAMMPFVALGLWRLRDVSLQTRVLILGLLATWLVLHVLFLGGARFHHPELVLHALLAAQGVLFAASLVRGAASSSVAEE